MVGTRWGDSGHGYVNKLRKDYSHLVEGSLLAGKSAWVLSGRLPWQAHWVWLRSCLLWLKVHLGSAWSQSSDRNENMRLLKSSLKWKRIHVLKVKVVGYGNGHGSEVQTEQLAVTACVRPQTQNTDDKSRGMTKTCTAKSYEISLRSSHAGVVKVREFLTKFRFSKQSGGTNYNAEGQFVTFSRSGRRLFQKAPLTFWEKVCFC